MRERLMSGEKLTRVLVTGGSGFLGSHIADELVRRGHAVVVLDLQASEAVDREVVIADYLCWLGSDQNTYLTGQVTAISGGE